MNTSTAIDNSILERVGNTIKLQETRNMTVSSGRHYQRSLVKEHSDKRYFLVRLWYNIGKVARLYYINYFSRSLYTKALPQCDVDGERETISDRLQTEIILLKNTWI